MKKCLKMVVVEYKLFKMNDLDCLIFKLLTLVALSSTLVALSFL